MTPPERARLLRLLGPRLTEFVPQSPTHRQAEFLSLECREALYGGAAGGGKSSALLMAALQYVDIPSYAAILFRRTYADLALPGALLDRAAEWLSGTPAKYNSTEKRWTFPSGASLSFGYLEIEKHKYRYQSAEFQFIGFDELTQFEETQYRYLFSRLRRLATSDIPLRMRAASNPGGVGHEWVKKRFIGGSRVFVPAKLDDNPYLDRAEYVESLSQVDPITRQQLLAGDWDAYEGGRFKREWFTGRYYTRRGDFYLFGDNAYMPDQIRERLLTVDPAATVPKTVKDDPDYTVISAWGKTPCGKLAWLGCKRVRCEIPDIANLVAIEYARHKAGKAYVEGFGIGQGPPQLCRRHPANMNVIEFTPKGKDKLTNATDALNMAEAGRVWLPADDRSFPLEEVEGELFRFTGDPKQDAHDDVVDTLSKAASVFSGKDGNKTTKVAGPVRRGAFG